jgi:MoxR-like ATPase
MRGKGEKIMSESQIILDGLKPLFEKARKEKLLFRSNYQGVLFTPDELEKAQDEGRFVWGPSNWELVHPANIKAAFEDEIDRAKREYQFFLDRLKATGY